MKSSIFLMTGRGMLSEGTAMTESSEIITILRDEIKALRDKAHNNANDVTGLKLTITRLELTIAKLESKPVCDQHMGFIGKVDQTCTNTEVIKTNLENFGKRLNGVIETISDHVKESVPYREKTIKHDEYIAGQGGAKKLQISILVTVILGVIGIAVTWGEMRNRISNLESYTQFIMKNSYGVQDWEKSHAKPGP